VPWIPIATHMTYVKQSMRLSYRTVLHSISYFHFRRGIQKQQQVEYQQQRLHCSLCDSRVKEYYVYIIF